MKKVICLTTTLFLFVLSAMAVWAQAFPSLEAAPAAYEYAQQIGGNNVRWLDLAEVSLWASAVNAGQGAEAKAASYLDRIKAAAEELSASALPQNPKERGEAVLTFLHKKFLKSYSEFQTRVDEIFISGRYNCVSSSVLYMVFCISVGLEVEGVMTKDHAFVSVKAGSETIDVETTNPYGFDPGNRKDFHDAFGKTTGFAYVPAKNYRDRALINAAEMVSLILSNRIAVLERGNRFSEAVPLAINRAVLLSNTGGAGAVPAAQVQNVSAQNNTGNKTDFFEDPQKDLMSRLTNLGAFFIKNGKEDDAIAWAEYAGKRYPDSQRWQEMIKTAANNKLVKLIRAKKTSDARSALTVLKGKLSNENYSELDIIVLEAEAADKVNNIRNPGDSDAALAFLAQNWDRLPSNSREEMRSVAILAEADRYGKAKNWLGGMRYLADAMEKYGKNARMENAMKIMRQNRVGELHNEFAALFNKRNYTEAKTFIQKALQEFPEEKQLLQDLVLVEKALQQ
ncbi:MAG: hypothetical protein FWG07_04750 [Treponema sp.]|nr:hypothetical protein [Treponema sp.]